MSTVSAAHADEGPFPPLKTLAAVCLLPFTRAGVMLNCNHSLAASDSRHELPFAKHPVTGCFLVS
jgi:hypothetical protein